MSDRIDMAQQQQQQQLEYRTQPEDGVARVPSSMVHALTITKYELLNYFRSRRFLILLSIALLIGGLQTALVGYYRPASYVSQPLGFYANWWGQWINLILVLSAIFFGGDSISGEFQNKTGYFLVGNPIRRSAIYIGKWIAAFTASLLVVAVFAGVSVANGLYYFGLNVPGQFGLSFGFAVLYLLSVLAFTFFFSSLFKSSVISTVLTAVLFIFVFGIVEVLLAGFAQIETWFLVTYGAGIIRNVLLDPYPEHVTTIGGGGPRGNGPTFTSYNPTIPEGIVIMLVYFAVTAVLGLILFERKEFT